MNRGHITLTGVLVALGALGAAFYTGTERLIELDQKLGVSHTRVDTLEARVANLERRLRVRPGRPQAGRDEGVLRRIWHLVF